MHKDHERLADVYLKHSDKITAICKAHGIGAVLPGYGTACSISECGSSPD